MSNNMSNQAPLNAQQNQGQQSGLQGPQNQQFQQVNLNNQNLTLPTRLYQHVLDLTVASKREGALTELIKSRDDYPDLAPILWHSVGVIAALLQEIMSIYPVLNPPRLTPAASTRCCNVLALLQCIASHRDTRSLFLTSHLGLFLYPFLSTQSPYRQYEFLRLTSLGVIGALVKMDDSEVTDFLLKTEIIPLCLRVMDTGTEISKTVATFIIQKILLDDMGLNYVCASFDRFSTVSSVLAKMVGGLVERPSVRLLKHTIRCYLRLSDNSRARNELRSLLPVQLRNNKFQEVMKDDSVARRWLRQLLFNLRQPMGTGQGIPSNQQGNITTQANHNMQSHGHTQPPPTQIL